MDMTPNESVYLFSSSQSLHSDMTGPSGRVPVRTTIGKIRARLRSSTSLRPSALATFSALLLVLSGCGRSEDAADDGAADTLLALSASDLQHALPVIAERYEALTGQSVEIVLGSTGNLATQIENGAPADVFLAANEAFVARLEEGGHVAPGSRRVYGRGRVVLTWSRSANPADSLASLLDPRFETISMANPEHAPYGMAAREALVSAGLLPLVEERLVFAENVSQAQEFVRSGNADAGLVALSVVLGDSTARYIILDESLHKPLRQAGAVISGGETEAAAELLDFIMGEEGQAILKQFGFEPA